MNIQGNERFVGYAITLVALTLCFIVWQMASCTNAPLPSERAEQAAKALAYDMEHQK